MPATTPLYLRVCIIICKLLALAAATIHYLISLTRILKISPVIINAPHGNYKNLRRIWFTRLVKRVTSVLLRSPLRRDVTRLLTVDFNDRVSKNAVIVCCHTPWARLIASWCNEHNYSMIIGGRVWEKRVSIANHVGDHHQIKELVRYLQAGGRVIIMADVFTNGNDCPVRFMGEQYNASLFPLRLAKATNAKLITVIPRLKEDRIQIAFGPGFYPNDDTLNFNRVMQDILEYLEGQIRKDPSVWLRFIRNTSAEYINEKSSESFTASPIELLNVERSASLH